MARGRIRVTTLEQDEEMYKLYVTKKWSIRKIGYEYNLPYTTVHNKLAALLQQHNKKFRSRGTTRGVLVKTTV